MDAGRLLHWQYLIYLLPGGVSAFLLLLSSLRLGHHRGAGGGQGHGGHHAPVHEGGHSGHGTPVHDGAHATHTAGAHAAHTAGAHAAHTAGAHAAHTAGAHAAHTAGAHAAHTGGTHDAARDSQSHAPHSGTHSGPQVQAKIGRIEVTRHGPHKENMTVSANLILHVLGADRAPLAMLLEAFCLVWGLCGYWANEFTVHTASPQPAQMLPSLGIALGGGIIGARLAATVLSRVMPQDESQDVSREALYGMTGRVVFPVSATGGRIHIYDAHGTLHDETCRLAPGHEAIGKGRTVLITDRDAQGNLLVEEVAARG